MGITVCLNKEEMGVRTGESKNVLWGNVGLRLPQIQGESIGGAIGSSASLVTVDVGSLWGHDDIGT